MTMNSPPFWLRNPHIQTVLPSTLRKVVGLSYTRERIETPDGDFLDLDWSRAEGRSLAILSHGLEGNSHRPYVKGMVKALNGIGVDGCAWNYRACSGETNRLLRMYHNGSTGDLDTVIRHAIGLGYERIVLVGFSMGGNLSLLYLGQQGEELHLQVKGAVAFSAPLDLADSAERLARPLNTVYMQRFLRKLHAKIRVKMERFPGQIDDRGYQRIRDFKAFDDRYTAPIHGFADAGDYWEKCSSRPWLSHIRVPTLIVNAADDPFLGPKCLSMEEENPCVSLEVPEWGGHIGFMLERPNGRYASELRAVQFLREILS